MGNEVMMSRLWRAGCVTLGLAVAGFVSEASAAKVERDPSVSAVPQPPKAVQPAPVSAPDLPKLTAAQIAEKNVAARGGLQAWRSVQTMQLSGRMEVGGKTDTYLPYTLQVKRPNKQRLEIEFAGNTSVQVYDGKNGWKLRPDLNRADPEPFSPEELRKTQENPGFDGPLIDYVAKGSRIEVDGTEMVEGKATYRLKVTNKQGLSHHIWIDAKTFLEAKAEDNPRRFDGKVRPVETYFSDYREVQGVMIPYLSETRVQGGAHFNHKMTVEKVALNPRLDDALFGKPAPAPLPPPRVFTMAPAVTTPTPNAAPNGSPAPAVPAPK